MALPENIDATYADRSPGDKQHQQDHDAIHHHVNTVAGNPHGVTAAQTGAVPAADVGAPGGVAPLDADGLLPEQNVPARLTEPALNDAFVGTTDLVPLPPQPKFHRDLLQMPTDGPVEITLGAAPLDGSEIVWSNGALHDEGQYTLDGATLTISGVATGDWVRIQYAYPGDQTGGDAVVVQTAVVLDSFDRADSATSLGVADSGQPWVAQRGTWGISGGAAYIAVVASANDSAVIDSGLSDCTVQTKIAAVGGSQGLAVRATDADNAITTNLTGLYRRTAGANTLLASFSTAFVAGDTMRIRCEADALTVYRQAASTGAFTQVATVTEAQGQTVTTHGFRQSGDTTQALRFDDFKVMAL